MRVREGSNLHSCCREDTGERERRGRNRRGGGEGKDREMNVIPAFQEGGPLQQGGGLFG